MTNIGNNWIWWSNGTRFGASANIRYQFRTLAWEILFCPTRHIHTVHVYESLSPAPEFNIGTSSKRRYLGIVIFQLFFHVFAVLNGFTVLASVSIYVPVQSSPIGFQLSYRVGLGVERNLI